MGYTETSALVDGRYRGPFPHPGVFADTSLENGRPEFTEPLDATWDLDAFAIEVDQQQGKPQCAPWIREMTIAELMSLLQFLDGLPRSRTHRERNCAALEQYFRRRRTSLNDHPDLRRTVVEELLLEGSPVAAEVRKRARHFIHKDDLPPTPGRYIKSPSEFRYHERSKLVVPNLQRIFSQHFGCSGSNPSQRLLMDIGAQHGFVAKSLHDLFESAVAIEPDERSFDRLLGSSPPWLKCYQLDLQTIMDDSELVPEVPDAIYMGHVLYYLFGEDQDLPALRWALNRLESQGVLVVTLNDPTPAFPSRAHLRKTLATREKNPALNRYRDFLERQGAAVRVLNPTLRLTCQTPEGMAALCDQLRYWLPDEAAHQDRAIERYAELVLKHGGSIDHRITMLVAYKDPSTAPRSQRAPVIPLGRSDIQAAADRELMQYRSPSSWRIRQILSSVRPIAHSTGSPPEPLRSAERSPLRLLETMEYALAASAQGAEGGLAAQWSRRMGIGWPLFRTLCARIDALRASGERGDGSFALPVPPGGRRVVREQEEADREWSGRLEPTLPRIGWELKDLATRVRILLDAQCHLLNGSPAAR